MPETSTMDFDLLKRRADELGFHVQRHRDFDPCRQHWRSLHHGEAPCPRRARTDASAISDRRTTLGIPTQWRQPCLNPIISCERKSKKHAPLPAFWNPRSMILSSIMKPSSSTEAEYWAYIEKCRTEKPHRFAIQNDHDAELCQSAFIAKNMTAQSRLFREVGQRVLRN